MGKRKDYYRNRQNAELFSNIRWCLDGAEQSIQAFEAAWYKYVQDKDIRAVEWLREALDDISKDIDELEKRLPTDAIRVIPKDKRTTRGKGKLNLHETDRELRDRVKVERYNQNT